MFTEQEKKKGGRGKALRSKEPLQRVSASPSSRLAALAAALLVGALLASGCSAKRTCFEGDFEACTCTDGRAGYAACDVAKDAYGACGSCGAVPGLAATSAGGAGGTGAGGGTTTTTTTPPKLGFMETCVMDSDCESGICHVFSAKGPKCTLHCQSAADCPPPSPGCNGMGFCKAP